MQSKFSYKKFLIVHEFPIQIKQFQRQHQTLS